MTSLNNNHTDFKVVLLGTVKADLRRFHEEMMTLGKGGAFLSALQKLNNRLSKDPRNLGETLYRLPALNCLVYQGIVVPLVVTYAVHDELPVVFVRVVMLLPNPIDFH